MKSMLIIGLGRFGHHLCKNLVDLDNEVMIIDERGINNEIEKNLDRFVNVCRSCSNICGYA